MGGDTENVSSFRLQIYTFLCLVGWAKDKNKNKNILAESDISVSLTLAKDT